MPYAGEVIVGLVSCHIDVQTANNVKF